MVLLKCILPKITNGDKIIAIGSHKTINYQYQSKSEMMQDYFKIIDESNKGILSLIDKYIIQSTQYFPIFGFNIINPGIEKAKELKVQQVQNLRKSIKIIPQVCKNEHTSIYDILNDIGIAETYKENAILWSLYQKKIELSDVERYLREYANKKSTQYRKLLCQYDYAKYSTQKSTERNIDI